MAGMNAKRTHHSTSKLSNGYLRQLFGQSAHMRLSAIVPSDQDPIVRRIFTAKSMLMVDLTPLFPKYLYTVRKIAPDTLPRLSSF